MPHPITNLAIMYAIVTTIYLVYVPNEDRAILVGILMFLAPFVVLAIFIDKFWKWRNSVVV